MPNKIKFLLIGWDAADWKVIEPLIKQGKMPALEGLMKEGVHGKLKTLDPPLSPMLWTSIATGFRADKHGIGGFVEPTPNGDSLRPVSSTSRKVKAIWNIFNQEGYKSNVVAWWPSNPAEPINGVMVSNLYQLANKPLGEPWEMPNGTIHPAELSETFKEFRVHPHEITLSMAIPFIPNIAHDKELRQHPRTASVLKILANAASVHAASTYLISETEWDFMAVYHDAIDHFSHTAMKYFPPRRPEIPEEDYENFNEIVEAAYRFHDMMLFRKLELIDEETTVMIISDHGFYSDHQRPLYIPQEPSGPAVEHSPYGIFVLKGPGIRKNQKISGASVLDITPTILHYFDLAVGKDMEGKVLHQCFEKPTNPTFIDSWENVAGNDGMHNEILREDPWAAQEALQQLVELGYIDAIEDDKLGQVEDAKRENRYYVARNMINGGRIDGAIEILEEIFNEAHKLRYGQRLAFAYLSKKQYQKCAEIIEKLKVLNNEKIELSSAIKDDFNNHEMEEPMYLDYMEGLLLLAVNKPRKALPLLEKVQKKNPNNLQLANNIAKIHLERKNYEAAEKQYITALAIDESNPMAHYGLGMTFLRRNLLNEALEEFLLSLELDFYFTNVHYHLGETLFKLGNLEDACKAFEVAIRLSPGMTKAHKWLVEIYENQLKLPEKANESKKYLNEKIVGEITICTGIENGGYENFHTLFDSFHLPFIQTKKLNEAISNLHQSGEFLNEYIGKMIFIPSHRLSFLPVGLNYKLVNLKLPDNQLIENLTYHKLQKKADNAVSSSIVELIRKEETKIETWISSIPSLKVIHLNWEELAENQTEQINILSEFLGFK